MPQGDAADAGASLSPFRSGASLGLGGGLSRRGFLRVAAISAGGLVTGFDRLLSLPPADAFPGGKLIGLVPFEDETVAHPATLIGAELDGRLFTDLSRLSTGRLVTPNSEFFIRSAASRLLPDANGWKVSIEGLVERPTALGIPTLAKAAKTMGVHLMECAGNVALTRFGLISAAQWSGVPLTDVLADAKPKLGAAWVEVSGFDDYSEPSRTSVPGASWIFPAELLKHAFLATGMNGQPLSRDHGAPVRLVVPGWYGCACIKWVNRIAFVEEGAEATSQMQEYAARTLQSGRPQLARDYDPATVDPAALPVRIEKWTVAGKIRYRIIGIAWGSSQPIKILQIRANPPEPFQPIAGFHQLATDPWSLWTHPWSPPAPGAYQFRLAIADPPLRARKLELGLYDRTVQITEI